MVIIFQGYKGVPKEKYLNNSDYRTDFLAFPIPLLNKCASRSRLLAKNKTKQNRTSIFFLAFLSNTSAVGHVDTDTIHFTYSELWFAL